ncbi:MAG: hypothetical protein F2817_17230, partial [Actinobacteria bacterium]|nr:hypothetical protein [Actinomycetota bacterium]
MVSVRHTSRTTVPSRSRSRTPMPDDPDLDDALRAVWTRRRPLVLQRLGVVEDALADGLEQRLSDEGRAEAERAAHQIAGSAGTFGFADASVAARSIEHALRDDIADPSTLLRVAGLAADLRAALEASAPSPDLHARAAGAVPAATPGTAAHPGDAG